VTVYLANLAAYSVQLAALVAAAFAATALLRLRTPVPSLRFWQVVLAASLILPLIQPWADEHPDVIASSFTVVSTSTPVAAIAPSGIDLSRVVLLVLAAGIAARLLWIGIGLIKLRAIVAHATPDDSLTALTNELAATLGVSAAAMVSGDLDSPATIGLRHPLVLVPRRALAMPPRVQRAIVCHELVHVKRRDWVQTLAEEIWCAALWFHPAARIAATRLSLARETVVDETTIHLTRDRRAYAEALLAFSNPQPHLMGATPFIGRRTLSQRISLIAEETPMPRRTMFPRLALALAVSIAVTATAITTFPMAATLAAQAGKVYKSNEVDRLPVVVREQKPAYTAAAMEAKIQGSVWLQVVVTEKGDVGEVTVTRSLDKEHGLDDEAVKAARGWGFKPATKDGKPVACIVTLELTFTLRK
jgi:TonB family protein